jgi:hypothetical protein
MDLTVLSVVEHDSGTFDLMIRSVLAFTDFVPKFLICLNGTTNIDRNMYRGLVSLKFVDNSPKYSGGSSRHGSGLDCLMPLVKTEYVAVIESDCVVLDRGWYKIDAGKKIKAASKGNGLYHVCFLVAATESLSGISFAPKGIGPSYRPEKDVGWQLGKNIRADQVDFVDLISCRTPQAKLFERLQSDEFHKDGKVIAAHFGRGANLAGKKRIDEFGTHEDQLKRWKETSNRMISKEEEINKPIRGV